MFYDGFQQSADANRTGSLKTAGQGIILNQALCNFFATDCNQLDVLQAGRKRNKLAGRIANLQRLESGLKRVIAALNCHWLSAYRNATCVDNLFFSPEMTRIRFVLRPIKFDSRQHHIAMRQCKLTRQRSRLCAGPCKLNRAGVNQQRRGYNLQLAQSFRSEPKSTYSPTSDL